jgi:dienelactone hydrolase
LVGGHDDNKTSLWTLGTDGAFNKINLGNVCPSWFFWLELSVSNNGRIAFVGSEPNHPSELYFLSSTSSKPERLTNFNKEVSEMTLGKTETIRWQTEGWKHCGIVTYPAKYDSSKKYPIVLIIHGGPFAASVDQFSRLSQLFSNEGYFVFEPNYRGSDNTGSKYRLAIMSDAGEGPGKDIMDGLAVLKRFPAVDSNKIGVTGWSYGGFMTVWLSGHYSGWSAAMAGAAVTDLSDQYNLGDYSINRASAMGGSPWVGDNMQRYIDQSPITEARKIKAPTLILANTGDPRVPITQSYKLFHALKDNGTVAKFIVWPINAHNASDPVTQMERDKYWLGWMNQYLK